MKNVYIYTVFEDTLRSKDKFEIVLIIFSRCTINNNTVKRKHLIETIKLIGHNVCKELFNKLILAK